MSNWSVLFHELPGSAGNGALQWTWDENSSVRAVLGFREVTDADSIVHAAGFEERNAMHVNQRPIRLTWLMCLTWMIATALGPVPNGQAPIGHASETVGQSRVQVARGDRGMVVSDSPPASRIGSDILLAGGSAVDAAVATALAMAVSWPDAGNIGGGGFMLVRPADGRKPVCIDYRETAPAVMNDRSFDEDDSTLSHKAVGVPGTIRGLAAAHQRFGRLPWRDLVLPAVRLALDGVPVDAPLADSLNAVLSSRIVRTDPRFGELLRVYGRPDGEPWKVGDQMVLPDLARTLKVIAEQGPDSFYTGSIARMLVEEMQRGDGLISLADLRDYRAKVRDVIRGDYRGYTILGAPPPSSGGICVIESLNILENFDIGSRDRYDPVTIHLIAEAARRAFADRARYLGDPDFVPIPDHLTSKTYARELASTIDPTRASSSEAVAPEIPVRKESPDTTHFSIVDGDGMAVSNTYTLEATWGSRLVVKNAGFVLNNEMGDFNWFPGVTNTEGRIGTPANTVAGGKRMLSSQSPVIVEKEGRLALVTGSPGGRTIINTVLCVLINHIDFKQSPADSVANVRMHHQWFPDRIQLERMGQSPHDAAIGPLTAMGHELQDRPAQGSAHTIVVDPKNQDLIGVADYRRGGRASGVRARTIALWDFADPLGTDLSRSHHQGEAGYRWSSNAVEPKTDGQDCLVIRHRETDSPWTSHLKLPPDSPGWTVEIVLRGARFSGQDRDEQVSFSFVNSEPSSASDDSNRVVATVGIGRQQSDGIVLSGHAGAEGAIGPIPVSRQNQLDRPVILRFVLDRIHHTLQVASRMNFEESFTIHGTITIASDSQPDRFEMSVHHDLANPGEYFKVDRIELASPPLESAVATP